MTRYTADVSHTFRTVLVCGTLFCGTLCALTGGLLSSPAYSEEFCVSCTEPFAVYRCAVDNNGELTAPSGAQLPCIKELARQGEHKSCGVRRSPAAECVGKLLIISPGDAGQIPSDHPINSPGGATAGLPAQEARSSDASGDETTVEGAEKTEPTGEPKTVAEMAKRTAQSANDGMKKTGQVVVDVAKTTGGHIKDAGSFVGNGAKKTWNCIVSLFSKCGG